MEKQLTFKKIAVIPFWNEEYTILGVLSSLESIIELFVLVNDGSTDNSLKVINRWKEGKNNIYLINGVKNRGMSWAVKEGLCFIQKNQKALSVEDNDIIIQVDADAQHSVESIYEIIEFMEKNKVDYLIVRRILKNYPLLKIIGNRLMSQFVSLLTFKCFHDVESGFRLMRVKSASCILFYTVGFKYSWAQEMAVISSRLGLKIDNTRQIPVQYYRKRGTRIFDAFINCIFSSLILHLNFCLKNISKHRLAQARF